MLKFIINNWYLKNSYIFVPAIKLKTKTKIMKTQEKKENLIINIIGIVSFIIYVVMINLYPN